MLIYKILLPAEWAGFRAAGRFDGSPFDASSGFVHCSTREQLAATAARFFGAEPALVVVTLDAGALDAGALDAGALGAGAPDDGALGAVVRWERASDGGVFPHVYASLPLTAVTAVHEVAGAAGVDAAVPVPPDR